MTNHLAVKTEKLYMLSSVILPEIFLTLTFSMYTLLAPPRM